MYVVATYVYSSFVRALFLCTRVLYVCVCVCARACKSNEYLCIWITVFYNVPFLGFQCYCNSYYDSSCIGQDIRTCPGEGGACEISIQFNPAVGNFTVQSCVENPFSILLCKDALTVNPGSSTPYRYCCTKELCNSEEALQQLIAGGELPLPVISSSILRKTVILFSKLQTCIWFVCPHFTNKFVHWGTRGVGAWEILLHRKNCRLTDLDFGQTLLGCMCWPTCLQAHKACKGGSGFKLGQKKEKLFVFTKAGLNF